MPVKGRPYPRAHGKDKTVHHASSLNYKRGQSKASKHADQIPAFNEHHLIPLHLPNYSRWHIPVSLGLHHLQYLAIVLLYLVVGSVGYLLHSSFIIGHSWILDIDPNASNGWQPDPSSSTSATHPSLCLMRSGAFQACCQCDYTQFPPTMTASRELSTPDLQPRPSVTGYHGKLSVPIKKTSSGLQSSATWTSNSGDYISDTDEISNRDDFVQEYNRLAKKACLPVSSNVLRLTDRTAAWRAPVGP